MSSAGSSQLLFFFNFFYLLLDTGLKLNLASRPQCILDTRVCSSPPQEGEGKTSAGCALDCGAGIGRISKRLLLPLFKTVDLVDVTQEFLDKAKTYLGEDGKRVGNYFCSGLQDFVPQSGRYDVIWIQWVIGDSARHERTLHLLRTSQPYWSNNDRDADCSFCFFEMTVDSNAPLQAT